MTAVAATLGGIKLSEKIAYDKKIARYQKIAKDFSKFDLKPDDEGTWYLPPYTDNEAWQTTHKNRGKEALNPEDGKTFLKKHPNWEDLRENCYKNAQENTTCNWTDGWCIECGRKTLWELEKNRGVQ